MITPDRVGEQIAVVRERIAAAGGTPGEVAVVAVTKGFGPEAVAAAVGAGLRDVGESYAQELAGKASTLDGADVRWHFIGRLQSNKVRMIGGAVSVWQSIDRAALVPELRRWAPGSTALVQLDVTGTPRRSGCRPGEVPDLVARLGDAGVEVVGLMAMGSLVDPISPGRPTARCAGSPTAWGWRSARWG
ncbi:MAG: alanine racemase [Acidimicrobiales bacterium]